MCELSVFLGETDGNVVIFKILELIMTKVESIDANDPTTEPSGNNSLVDTTTKDVDELPDLHGYNTIHAPPPFDSVFAVPSLKIFHGPVTTERKSSFQGLL